VHEAVQMQAAWRDQYERNKAVDAEWQAKAARIQAALRGRLTRRRLSLAAEVPALPAAGGAKADGLNRLPTSPSAHLPAPARVNPRGADGDVGCCDSSHSLRAGHQLGGPVGGGGALSAGEQATCVLSPSASLGVASITARSRSVAEPRTTAEPKPCCARPQSAPAPAAKATAGGGRSGVGMGDEEKRTVDSRRSSGRSDTGRGPRRITTSVRHRERLMGPLDMAHSYRPPLAGGRDGSSCGLCRCPVCEKLTSAPLVSLSLRLVVAKLATEEGGVFSSFSPVTEEEASSTSSPRGVRNVDIYICVCIYVYIYMYIFV